MAKGRYGFTQFSRATAYLSGHPWTFFAAVGIVIVWAVTGPMFHFSNTWQLVINTGTTIVTFLMVFLIQNTQNRDSQAVQIKLDELIRAMKRAHVALLDLEELSDEELLAVKKRYGDLAAAARDQMRRGKTDTGTPDVGNDRLGAAGAEGAEDKATEAARRSIAAEPPRETGAKPV